MRRYVSFGERLWIADARSVDISKLRDDTDLCLADSTTTSMVIGADKEAGADEDGFHILNRKRKEVDRDERKEKKQKRVVDTTAAAKAKAKTVYF